MSNKHKEEVKKILEDAGVGYIKIGKPTDERHILVSKDGATYQFGVDYMRDVGTLHRICWTANSP